MNKIYLTLLVPVLLSLESKSQNVFSENFDDVATLISTGGWTAQNNSVPLGNEVWHNDYGFGLAIPAYNGAPESYAEVSFASTDSTGSGNISNWLISPMINLNNGDVVTFYTSSYGNSNFPDRLEVRLNPNNTINVGSTDTTTGDFTHLLLSINSTLVADTAQYPEDYWGQFSITISGLSGPTNCRLAFRYFVTDGGGTGANSSTIGIDAFSVDLPVGINELSKGNDMNVYPNPASDHVTIDFANPLIENGFVRIYNTLGQAVTSFNVSKGQTKALIGTSSFAPGLYSIVLESSGTFSKRNLIKN